MLSPCRHLARLRPVGRLLMRYPVAQAPLLLVPASALVAALLLDRTPLAVAGFGLAMGSCSSLGPRLRWFKPQAASLT